jgi:chemotaxis protein MotB
MRKSIILLVFMTALLPSCIVSKFKYDSTVTALKASEAEKKNLQTQNQQVSLQLDQLTSERDTLLIEIQQKNEAQKMNLAELMLCKDQLNKLQIQLSKKNEELEKKE